MLRLVLMVTLMITFSNFVAAQDEGEQAAEIRAKLIEAFPNFTPDSIKPSALPGFHEAAYGIQVIYVSNDGRYVIEGNLFDIGDNRKDLTELSQAELRKEYLVEVQKQESINFGSKKPKHVVTVFTDIDCPYCRKLHDEMDEYASYGIQVNYLLFPRTGLSSAGYHKSVSIWCSDDRADALTRAKAGEDIGNQACENPVKEHYQIGKKVGVTGTPAVLTEDGRLFPGYLPAKQMAQRLDQK